MQVEYERILITSSIPEDPDVVALVEAYAQDLNRQLDMPAGPTATQLEGRFKMVRSRETNLGNLVADIALATLNVNPESAVDCVLLNGGTLRSDTIHPAGTLLKKVCLTPSLLNTRETRLQLPVGFQCGSRILTELCLSSFISQICVHWRVVIPDRLYINQANAVMHHDLAGEIKTEQSGKCQQY